MSEESKTINAELINEKKPSELSTVAFIFMILSCVFEGIFIIPLCWLIPMTVHYHNVTKNGGDVGVGFKVCTLLFANLISGILMLCDTKKD